MKISKINVVILTNSSGDEPLFDRVVDQNHCDLHYLSMTPNALKTIKKLHPDLIIFSCGGIYHDALTLCRKIKQAESLRYVYVLVVTDPQVDPDMFATVEVDEHVVLFDSDEPLIAGLDKAMSIVSHHKPFLDDISQLTSQLSESSERCGKLKKQLKTFQQTIDQCVDMVLWVSVEGKIIYGNQAACDKLQYTQKELLTLSIIDIDPILPQEDWAEFLDVMKSSHSNTLASTFITKSGQEFPVEIASNFHQSDGSGFYVLFAHDIAYRQKVEKALSETNMQLVESSHVAGMAEVATDVLNNVGNVLNSVTNSITSIDKAVRFSRLNNLEKVVEIVQQHADNLASFLTESEQGQQLPNYFSEVSKQFKVEQDSIIEETTSLAQQVNHIKNIIKTQQSIAKVSGMESPVRLEELIDDAIEICNIESPLLDIQIQRTLEALPQVRMERQKVLQIIVNLINNAKYAVLNNKDKLKEIHLDISDISEQNLRISVKDNGEGIKEQNMAKIFQHGFTTKKEGHGFGLYSSALIANDMGGSLTAHSDGKGQGAIFTLEIPYKLLENDRCNI